MSHRRLNVRFVLSALASLIVLCTGTYFVHGYQIRRNANVLLDRADRAQKDGKPELASDYYRRYLGFVPKDAEALARYGLLLAEPGVAKSKRDTYRAIQVMQRALINDPKRHELRRNVVRLSIDQGLFSSARRDLEEYLIREFPQDGELALWLGQCHEHSGSYAAARDAYQRAMQQAPSLLESYLKQATLLRRHIKDVLRPGERAIDAEKLATGVMDAMIAANPSTFRAFLLHAEDRRTAAAGQPKTAEIVASDIARARELQPDSEDVLMAAADFLLEQNRVDESRDILRDGCRLHPNSKALCLALARLEAKAGNLALANSILRDGLSKSPNQPELLWDSADLLIRAGRLEEAKAAVESLEKVGVAKIDADCFRARLLMNNQQWLQAISILEDTAPKLAARASQSDDAFVERQARQGDLLLGASYEQVGDLDRALLCYGRVIARDSRSIPGRLGLARALTSIGRIPDAIDQYRQLDRLPNAPSIARLEFAHLLLLRNLDREPARRDWDEVQVALDAVDEMRPLPVQAVVYRCQMLAAQGQFAKASTHLLNSYSDASTRPLEAWLAMIALEDGQGHTSATLEMLNEAEKAWPRSVELRLARARQYFRTHNADAEAGIDKLTEGLEELAPAEQRQLLHGIATLAMQSGDTARASQNWNRLATLQPGDLRCQVGLFDIAVQANDSEKMKETIDKMRKIEGNDGTHWRYARAAMLIANGTRGDKSGLQEARFLLAAVSVRRSYWSRLVLCQARLDDLEGNHEDAALAGYLRVLALGDNDPFAFRRAIELLYKGRRYAEAYDLIRRLPDQSTEQSPELRRLGAQLALYSRDGSNALKLAESTITDGSKDFRDYVWLGRVYLALGKVEQAGPAFRHACELAPSDPDARVALVQFLAVTGKKDQALAEIDAAKAKLTDEKAALALAYCYEAIDMPDLAKTQYDMALTAQPNDMSTIRSAAIFYFRVGQVAQAEPLLRRLANDFKTESPDTAKWARGRLAILLSVQGDANRVNEALAMLAADEASLSSAGERVELQRTRATILSMQNSPRSRRDAVKILEGLIERRVSVPQDYFLAAQLHELLGDWPRARYRYLGFMEMSGVDSPTHLYIVARTLLRHNDAEEASQFVTRFLASVGDLQSIEKTELQARMLNANGKSADAIALIRSYSASDGANLLQAAELLVEFKALDAAEEMYRRHAERTGRPTDSLILAQFLLGRNRYGEVLQICDQVWENSPSVAVAEIALAALSIAPRDPRLFEPVERRLDMSIKKFPESAAYVTALAGVRNFQGRYEESEQLYRRALSIDPKLEVALNNLAWLLTLRTGSGAEALELLQRAALISGTHAGLRDTRGMAYLSLKQKKATDSAIDDLRIATDEAPSAATYFHLAQAYLAAGRRQDASSAWRNAKKLNLGPEALHPLERPVFEQLTKEFN